MVAAGAGFMRRRRMKVVDAEKASMVARGVGYRNVTGGARQMKAEIESR